MPADRETPTPAEQVARLYEQAEAQAAKAGEHLVGSQGFASLLGQLAENAAAAAKLGNDAMDLVLRNLRLAGRRDVVRLARQLGRTEDKLERVLQELEELRDQLRERDEPPSQSNGAAAAPRRAGTRRAGAKRAAPADEESRAAS
ncbi:MAG TPA: hypothetical protein VFN87_10980 [Solirubrobacteraceae bacterium]|nr:hypothetical protein [Solirubrobacteraceae bacterium]